MIPILTWKRAYDHDDAVICLLDANLKIARCNSAWDRFALSNGGESAVAEKVVGASIMDVVPPDLQDFYLIAYRNVQRFQRDWWHVFECSAPTVARVFQMRILPSDDQALLIINTLIRETPAEAVPSNKIQDYAGSDGVVTMCSHCRRVENVSVAGAWDWFPELLSSGKVLTKFGLCAFCTAYHYHLQ